MKRILLKLTLILALTCSCNSLKNKWELYHLEFGENIKSNTNQYGFVLKKDSMEKFYVKTMKGKKKYVLLTFRPNGKTLRLVKIENYKNNRLDGFYSTNDNSIDSAGIYKNGRKHGFWSYGNDMGEGEEGRYRNGQKHGIWKEYTPFITAKGKYKHGKKNGLWTIEDIDLKIINEKGKEERVIDKVYYKNGVEVKK